MFLINVLITLVQKALTLGQARYRQYFNSEKLEKLWETKKGVLKEHISSNIHHKYHYLYGLEKAQIYTVPVIFEALQLTFQK